MATVDKNFRVKNGLVVEGTTGTIDGNNIVTDADTTDILSEGTSNFYFTDQRARDAVTSGVTTDGIGEGTTNFYFTDERVQEVLVNSVQKNIEITSTDGVLFITSENGVGDSTTDDLDEGTVNLYYTDERVRGAVSAGGGLDYDGQAGEFSVSTGPGLEIDQNDAVAVDAGEGLGFGESGELLVDTDVIATIAYVDATAEGLHVHTAVEVATTENISDLSSPPASIDGVTLTEGMRVLVKNQETESENGIYVVESGALIRAEDHDTAEKVRSGDFVFVTGGSTQSATGWVQINNVTALETDPIEWTQFIGAGVFTAGNGLDLTGNVFSLDATTDLVPEGTTNLYYTDGRVESVIAGSDTDDLSEGTTNLYYTDARVEAVIANSDTDDISEGTTNLYFTDQRAVDAVEGASSISIDDLKVEKIEIDGLASNWAYSTEIVSAESPTTVAFFPMSTYRTAKFLVKVASGTHTQISEILVTLDTSDNIAITEYAIVSTNGSLGEITATENGTDVQLVFEATGQDNTVTVFGTLIK